MPVCASDKLDVTERGVERRDFGADQTSRASSFFIADPQRLGTDDGGWLTGFVHRPNHRPFVLDAEHVESAAVATVRGGLISHHHQQGRRRYRSASRNGGYSSVSSPT